MRELPIFMLLMIGFYVSLLAQNEFGTVGSYWKYNFEPHSGGTGWTMIEVEKDTVINGELFKILHQTHYEKELNGPNIYQYSTRVPGLMKIRNDSVFLNEKLILDFTMSIGDTLQLYEIPDIQLTMDSLTKDEIGPNSYKVWHGQKHCANGSMPNGIYESATILETVGQIASDYLLWDTEGCTIGGGKHYFDCYNNGNFTYPPSISCLPMSLPTNTTDINSEDNEIIVFPNPVSNNLTIELTNTRIEEVIILNLEGKELFHERGHSNLLTINVEALSKGVYLIKINTKNQSLTNKFIII